MKLIDKDALVAEIEKYYNECLKRAKITDPDYWNAKADACRNVLAILDDTLEVKDVQEEPVSEELNEAAIYYADTHTEWFDADNNPHVSPAFKAGAKWQEKKDQSTIELAEDHAMLAGMEKMKEQMIKDATEAIVAVDVGGYPYIPQIELYDYDKDVPLAKEGDKYKVVFIKED